ncbi:MAG: DNA-binding protein [Erythrobacter sp.]|nr:MAG: DNA-binding protein [Erythrobacter sp.]
MGNDKGTQFRCSGGEVINLYDSGKVVVQGKRQSEIKGLFGIEHSAAPKIPKATPHNPRKVFVVYGHDTDARDQLEAMLRRWGLDPLILDQLTSGGQTIIEKLESVQKEANFAVVLATPDDQGHRSEHPEELAYRARQNVVLELGMMLSVLGRERVAILLKGQEAMEKPSDIQGLLYIPFKENVDEAKLLLAKEIDAKGIPIDLKRV